VSSTGVTHVLNWSVASNTVSLISLNFFPFSPLSRAMQTSAHASPSST